MTTIIIAGGGIMGASMAQAFGRFDFQVYLYDISKQALDKARDLIAINQRALVDAGVVDDKTSKETINRINLTTDTDVFGRGDVVIESIVEKLEVKEQFYRQISKLVRGDCIICSNTSAIPISTMAQYVDHPERFLGMHWFNPAHLIPLIEIIKGDRTQQSYVDKIFQLALAINKQPVIINKDVKGFVANRIQFAIVREALHLVENEVISIADLDKVMKYSLGLRYESYGPLEIADFGGLDTFYHISEFLNPDLCDSHEPSKLLGELVKANRLGVKTTGGFYDYDDNSAKEAISHRDNRLIRALQKETEI